MKIRFTRIMYFAAIISLFWLTACVNFPVNISRDPFKNGVTVITADMWHTVIDSRIDNTRVIYHKYIKNGVTSVPTATFEFVAKIDPYFYCYHGESFKPEAYILADNAQFMVNLTANENLKQEVEIRRLYFRPMVIIPDVQRFLIAKIILTPEIQEAILKSQKYMIRFYLGDAPLTLEATGKQLEALKKFLAATGEPVNSVHK